MTSLDPDRPHRHNYWRIARHRACHLNSWQLPAPWCTHAQAQEAADRLLHRSATAPWALKVHAVDEDRPALCGPHPRSASR